MIEFNIGHLVGVFFGGLAVGAAFSSLTWMNACDKISAIWKKALEDNTAQWKAALEAEQLKKAAPQASKEPQ